MLAYKQAVRNKQKLYYFSDIVIFCRSRHGNKIRTVQADIYAWTDRVSTAGGDRGSNEGPSV